MRVLFPYVESARKALQACGPYLLLELLLPGGTMFALLLFLYRRKGSRLAGFVQRLIQLYDASALRRVTERVMLPLDVYVWARRAGTRSERAHDGLEALALAPVVSRLCSKGEVIAVHW